MPSVKNPGLLNPGVGAVSAKAVPSAALMQPHRDIDSLKAHMNDPKQAHMASAIGIVDAGGYFASDDVEDALQELCASGGAGRQNGVLTGCTFTTAGRVVTLDAGSKVLIGGTLRDVAGDSVTCAIIAGTYYVYFDGTSGTLVANTALPDLADEPVLICEVTHNGTNVTASRDARFFVANLDRKLDYTARADAGTAADNEAEACFVTLEAAFFWLENYAVSQDTKRTLIVRGAHTVSNGLVLSVPGVEIRGEGAASITFDSADQTLLEAVDSVILRDLTFVCASAYGTPQALMVTGGTSGFLVDGCSFVSGSTDWSLVVNVSALVSEFTVRDCYFETKLEAIFIFAPKNAVIENVVISGPGASTALSRGIVFFDIFGTHPISNNRVVNARISDIETGVYAGGIGSGLVLSGGSITQVKTGVSLGTDTDHALIEGLRLDLDATVGLVGVSTQAAQTSIANCTVSTTRNYTSYGAGQPFGIQFTGAATQGTVVGCHISGFTKDSSGGAQICGGVHFDGQSAAPDGVVAGCIFTDCGIRIYRTEDVSVQNCTFAVDTAYGSYQDLPIFYFEEAAACNIQGNNIDCGGSNGYLYGAIFSSNCSKITFSGNHIRGAAAGIYGQDVLTDCVIEGNTFSDPWTPNPATAGHAIYLTEDATRIQISGNVIDGYTSATPYISAINGITLKKAGSAAPSQVLVSGNTISRCRNGIMLEGTATVKVSDVSVVANNISYCAYWDATTTYDDIVFADSGSKAIGSIQAQHVTIAENHISKIGLSLLDDGTIVPPSPYDSSSNGVYTHNVYPLTISGNVIESLNATKDGQSHGVHTVYVSGVGEFPGHAVIQGNTLNLVQDDIDSGTATGGGVSSLTDATKSWTVDAFVGKAVILTGGTGSGQVGYVLNNTATFLSMTAPWVTPPDGTTTYAILWSGVNGTAGIRHTIRKAFAVAGFTGLSVCNNKIHMHDSTSAYMPYTHGIYLDADNDVLGATLHDVRVCDNMVQGWGLSVNNAGLRVEGDATGSLSLYQVRVDGNSLLSTGVGSSNIGVGVSGVNGDCRDMSLSGNTIDGQTDSYVPEYGIYFSMDASDVAKLTVHGNHVRGTFGIDLTQATGTGSWDAVAISGNTFDGDGAGHFLTVTPNDGDLLNSVVSGNVSSGTIISGLDLQCNTVTNVVVADNAYTIAPLGFASGVDISVTSKGTVSENLRIAGNQVYGEGYSGAKGISVRLDSSAFGVSLCDNSVVLNDDAAIGIGISTQAIAPGSWKNFRIQGNSVAGGFTSAGAYAMLLDTTNGATECVPSNWVVSGNTSFGSGVRGGLYVGNASGSALVFSNNVFTNFATCAAIAAATTNSVCLGNISQDGGAGGFQGGNFATMSVHANNLDY